ncbi:MAG: hypothetical protein ABII89_06590, partial [Candidatus Omnitrophota bacterium]
KPDGWVIPAGNGTVTVEPARDEKGNPHMLYQDISEPTWANMYQTIKGLQLPLATLAVLKPLRHKGFNNLS